LLDPEDTLEDGDPLDEGYSPPERPWAVNDWGTTAREESTGESLDGRLARELAEPSDDDSDGLGDATDTDGELLDDEVGDYRAGRLVATDEGFGADTDGLRGGSGDARHRPPLSWFRAGPTWC
jgi:hypothetical protein